MRFPLRTRILLAFSFFYLLTLAAGGYAATKLRALDSDFKELNDGFMPLARVAAQLQGHQERMELDLASLDGSAARALPTNRGATIYHDVAFVTTLANGRRILLNVLGPTTDGERLRTRATLLENLERLAELQREYEAARTAWIGAVEKRDEEEPASRERLAERQRELREAVLQFTTLVEGMVRQAGGRHALAQAEIRAVGGAFAGGTLLIGLLLMLWTIYTLKPIERLTTEVQRLASGDYAAQAVRSGDDEIGALAREFNAMAVALKTRDQSLQARAEELRRLSGYLGKVIDTIHQALLVVEGGRIRRANPAASLAWNLREGMPLPVTLQDLAPGAHAGVPVGAALYHVEVLPFGDEGRLVLGEDVTARLQAEEHRARTERLALIGQMLAQVCHEIRNPLNALSLNTEMLGEEISRLDPSRRSEASELVEVVAGEIRRLEEVTERYLELVRRPTGDLTSTDLAELLRSLTRAEEAGFNAAGIRLLLKLSHMSPKNGSGRPEASEARAWVDAGQLRRALLNVLRNAQQSACREVVLEIQVHPERVDILVADDGRGMEPDVRDRAFEPFFTTRPRGTGLGLALTRQIVEMHGGRVHMDTEPGNGCRVTISLPRARADDSSPPGSTGSPFADEESAPSPSEPPSEPPAPLPR